MLEPGSPSTCGQYEKKATAISQLSSPAPTVSPPPMRSSRHVCSTRSSTLGLTSRSLDGTPQYLSPSSLTPSPVHTPLPSHPRPPRCASAPPLDMAINPPFLEELPQPDGYFAVKALPIPGCPQYVSPPLSSMDAAPPPPVLTPDAAVDEPVPELGDVARLLRLQKYQHRRRLQSESEFRHLQITISKTNRLAIAARHVQRTLTDCLRSGDKTSFVNLYDAFQEACIEHPKPPSQPSTEPAKAGHLDADGLLHGLSSASRSAVVTVLSRLRYDGQFVADRLSLLTQMELATLLPDGGSSRSGESVLGCPPRSSKRSTRPLGFIVDRQIEDLAASTFRNSLETLVHIHMPSNTHTADPLLPTDVWATVCANLIREKKPGSERLLPALLDIWSSHGLWRGKSRLRLWILQTLQDGQFLLEPPSRPTFSMRMNNEFRPSADETDRAETFYVQRVNSLLDLLGDNGEGSAIPDGSRNFCHAIYNKLAAFPEVRKDMPDFILTRWLFASFLPDLITSPESHGMLTGHYISDLARQRILREVVVRSQKAVSGVVYAWYLTDLPRGMIKADDVRRKYGQPVSGEVASRVGRISATLNFDAPSDDHFLSHGVGSTHNADSDFVAISATDLLTVINALYPSRRPASVCSDRDTLRSGVQSSTSSTSGYSLFRAAEPLPPRWVSTPSLFPGVEQAEFLFSPVGPSVWPETPSQDAITEDRAVADARIELEEWLAAAKTEDESKWSVFLAKDDVHVIVPYSENLALGDAIGHDVSSYSATIDGKDLSFRPGCPAAIEALLGHVDLTGGGLRHASRGLHRADSDLADEILDCFEHQVDLCEAADDHVAAHAWVLHMGEVEATLDATGSSAITRDVIRLRDSFQNSIKASLAAIEQCESWLSVTRSSLPQATASASLAVQACKQLRVKMWYVADIRTSSAYENIRAIVSALRIMGKPVRSGESRRHLVAPPLRHWSGPRSPLPSGYLKSEAQILELLSTTPEHGGPNKLSDDQARTVSTWMDRNVSQLLCVGEERLHKLCMEVRKCVEQLTASSTSENPQLWSNPLFSRERAALLPLARSGFGLSALGPIVRRFDSLTLQTNIPPSIESVSSTSHTLSSSSSRDYFDTRCPTLTTKSSTTFWSPAMSEVQSPSSATSVGSYVPAVQSIRKSDNTILPHTTDSVAELLRGSLTGFFLSDVGVDVFNEGCETDFAFWSGLGGELVEQRLRSQCQAWTGSIIRLRSQNRRMKDLRSRRPPFDYESAFRSILRAFSYASDPYKKLKHLNEVEVLLKPYMVLHELHNIGTHPHEDKSTAAPSFQASNRSSNSTEGFYRLFCDSSMRPPHVFRDLQYIASLVPANLLHGSPGSDALGNAIAAASRLKSEGCQIFIETADSIIAHHTNARGHSRSSSHAQQKRDDASFPSPSHTPPVESIAQYTMEDAAYLLQIAAKEGFATAQRELATLYLTHPNLMDRILSPFARPKEVFREEFDGKGRRDRDPNRYDPGTMCVAIHWMVKAAHGGDALARDNLRERAELEKLP